MMLFAADGLSLRPGDHARSLEVEGQRRGYLVHVPLHYDPATPTPVVLAFHGGGGRADTMAIFSGLNEKADKAGFIVAYQLAAELSDRIAAIAPIGGPMGTKECRPGRAVSVMHFHGDADAFAPFKGGREPRMRALGVSTRDISANDLMWEFFEKHPLPAMP